MKTLILMLTIKLLVICPLGQQPDSAEKARTEKANAAKGKTAVKPVKGKGSLSNGLLYRIPLSI